MKKYRHFVIVAAILCTAILLSYLRTFDDKKAKQSFAKFPMVIGDWNGKVDRFDEYVYEKLGVDDSVLSHYSDNKGNYVELYIGFHESQREGDMIHSPKNCMVGGGWNIVESSLVGLNVPSEEGREIDVVLLKLQKDTQRVMVLYWYHSRGRVISSEYKQRFFLVVDAITRKRTDGSFIRLISPVKNDDKRTLEILKKFAVDLFPIIEEYIPS